MKLFSLARPIQSLVWHHSILHKGESDMYSKIGIDFYRFMFSTFHKYALLSWEMEHSKNGDSGDQAMLLIESVW